jgi:predicted RNA-binding Zn-ribbon protein involved in translation (DUF1610 family)
MTSPAPVFILIALLGTVVYVFVRTRTTHFECPNCGRSFKLSYTQYLIREIFLSRRSSGRRYVNCPYCGNSELMSPIRDKES